MGGQQKLFNFEKNNQRNYKIAFSLYEINDTENYRPEFENIVDFVKEKLGYKQAMTYKMVSVGQKFIYYDNDCQSFVNIFGADYTISQLIQMTSFEVNDLMLLHVAGEIKPEMTVKELKKVLKTKLK